MRTSQFGACAFRLLATDMPSADHHSLPAPLIGSDAGVSSQCLFQSVTNHLLQSSSSISN
eukprot:m.71202 g.71202  ORF g.71202 m.71202 type:complete len:60 (+) comp14144_c0_seq3:125-304(+)